MGSLSDYVLGDILIDAKKIAGRVCELGKDIDATYAHSAKPLVLITVLKGSLFFCADLARAISIPIELDFVACRSYGDSSNSSGSVQLVKDVGGPLNDRDVLVVEDIIDTGITTSFLLEHLKRHQPKSLRLAALMDKKDRREQDVTIDFAGFPVPNEFVVGYGLDLAEAYRNLPSVHIMRPRA